MLLLFSSKAIAQISGVKHIPGDYNTLAIAIAQLNSQGLGPGGATLEVARGYTESITNLTLTASGSATSPLILRAATGTGTAPRFTGGTGTGVTDALLKLRGCDYVQLQGLDFVAPAQGSATTRFEWGVALLKGDDTPTSVNGCQHVEVSNCGVTMPLNDSETSGLYVANHSPTSTAQLTPTTAAGTNSFLLIATNRLIGGSHGLTIRGYISPTFTPNPVLLDTENQVRSNTVTNFNQLTPALSSALIRGVYLQSQRNLAVEDNVVTTDLVNASGIEGIWAQLVSGRRASASRNRVLLKGRGLNSSATCLAFASTAVYTLLADNRCALDMETVYNGPQGIQTLTAIEGGGRRVDALRNLVTGSITTGSGRLMLFMGLHIGVDDSSVVSYNRVQNLVLPTAIQVQGIHVRADNFTTGVLIERNTVGYINSSGSIWGIYNYFGDEVTVARNRIGNLTSTFTGNTQPAVQGIYVVSNTAVNIQNNTVGQLSATESPWPNAVVGINAESGFFRRIYHNTVHLNASGTAATFGSSALYTPGPGEVDVRNNILVNRSAPGSAGITAAWRNNLGNPFTTNLATDYNIFYAGTPGASRVLYADELYPADNRPTLAGLQALWAPRNAHSLTENTPVASFSVIDADFLHLNAANQSLAESGGQVIVGFRHDVDTLNARPLTYPLPAQLNGGGTGPDIGADEGDYHRGTPLATTQPVAMAKLSVFPQPFSEILTLTGSSTVPGLPVAITVSNMLGQLQLRTTARPLAAGQWELTNLGRLPVGTYVLEVLPDGQYQRLRIQKH
jgi:hypothetical protein